MYKCKYGECKHFKNSKCAKEKEIANLPTEEIIKAMVTNECSLREENKNVQTQRTRKENHS